MSPPIMKPWALGFFALTAVALAQQDTRISGVVRDRNTHREISNVNVFLKSTPKGVVSDFAGRYALRIALPEKNAVVVFQHIAYEHREIALDSVMALRYVDLQPRVITLRSITVEDESTRRPEIEKDLPQTISVVEAKNFEIRGYVDAGDLLRTDHSVQVEEELSGRKTVAIRGGNSDEVVVLYDGVKMNSTFDNVFDLALIDLEDIDRFEVIKGSSTTLYGPEAFAGVINIVPKVQHDYNIRFQQRLGTYRSGNWGLHLDPSSLFNGNSRLNAAYSFKRGGAKREFSAAKSDDAGLVNSSLHHTANLVYHFSTREDGKPANPLALMYLHTTLDYDSRRDEETTQGLEVLTLGNLSRMLSLHYNGNISRLKNLDLAVSLRRLDETQESSTLPSSGYSARDIDDRSLQASAEKRVKNERMDVLLAYQFQRAQLDFVDIRQGFDEFGAGPERGDLQRNHHGLVAIAKWHTRQAAGFLQNVDVDLSLRHDVVNDQQDLAYRQNDPVVSERNSNLIFKEKNWRESTFNFSMNFAGLQNDLSLNAFFKFGNNTKFPTLFQQISVPLESARARNLPNLNPEKSRSVEFGVNVTREIGEQHPVIYGWGLSGIFFQNHYDNKFRTFSVYGDPRVYFDNVQDARISGFEAKPSLYFYRKKVTVEFGFSRYFISEKAAFPYKSDLKRTLGFIVDHAGYSFQLLWFAEGEQTGWVRRLTAPGPAPVSEQDFNEIRLDAYSNLDAHLSKTFEWGKLKFFLNVSGRNLLNSASVDLQGLALRDRRYYLTLGAQY